MLRVTKLFYSRLGSKAETYFPALALSKPEQATDNKKINKEEKNLISIKLYKTGTLVMNLQNLEGTLGHFH